MSGSAAAVLTKPAFRRIEWLARDIAVEREITFGWFGVAEVLDADGANMDAQPVQGILA